MIDICVFAMRGRPFGAQHLHNIREALDHGQYCFVCVGSAGEPINFRNPFTTGEVHQMIRGSLSPAQNDRVFLFAIEDFDTDLKWVTEVQRQVVAQVKRLSFPAAPTIALIGHSKDDSSYYLKMFPQWGAINTSSFGGGMSATDIRNALYGAGDTGRCLRKLAVDVDLPQGTFLFLRQWIHTDAFITMQQEYLHAVAEENKYAPHPYNEGHYHATADYFLFQSGAVLLVKRGEMPGKGLWAAPGGHIRFTERYRAAATRELCEETRILDLNPDLTADDLDMAIRAERLLDDPWRSTRMRTIGMAYGGILGGTKRLLVEGADDAREARFWPINELRREWMFEDHFINAMHFAGILNII